MNRKVMENKRQLGSHLDQELDAVLSQVKGIMDATDEQDKVRGAARVKRRGLARGSKDEL